MPATVSTALSATPSIQTRRLSQGIATSRILLGMTFLLNGIAKLFEFHRVTAGPYVANLIDRADAKFILNAEVNHNAQHRLPLIARVTNDLVLPHWTVFGWGLTAVEIVAGLLLMAGLWSRLGALIALGPAVFLFFVYVANDRWVPEQPLELVPLLMLAVVPSGRWWGLDRRAGSARWPS